MGKIIACDFISFEELLWQTLNHIETVLQNTEIFLLKLLDKRMSFIFRALQNLQHF